MVDIPHGGKIMKSMYQLCEESFNLNEQIRLLKEQKREVDAKIRERLGDERGKEVNGYIVRLSKPYTVTSVDVKAWRNTCPKGFEKIHERFGKDYEVGSRLTVRRNGGLEAFK